MASVSYIRRRSRPYADASTGALTWTKRRDESDTYSIDVNDRLAGGIIATAAAKSGDTSGVTLGAITNAAGIVTIPVTAGVGHMTLLITTTLGYKFEIPLCWLAPEGTTEDAYA